jgi:hypothetical protein
MSAPSYGARISSIASSGRSDIGEPITPLKNGIRIDDVHATQPYRCSSRAPSSRSNSGSQPRKFSSMAATACGDRASVIGSTV